MPKPLPEVFHYFHEAAFFIVLVALLLLVTECAFRYGRRRAANAREHLSGQVTALGGTLLGLVALMLGFAFGMALGRFNTRQDLLRQEVNDLQTSYLFADLLPRDGAQKMKSQIYEYTGLRAEYYTPGTRADQMRDNIDRTNILQNEMWTETVRLLERANTEKAGVGADQIVNFMNTLTRVFSDENDRTAARGNHIPEAIIWLLIFVSACATGTLAYGIGLKSTRIFWPNVVLVMAICSVLTIILDLDRPIRGVIIINQGSMAALHQTIGGDIKAPRE
ncbi:hypothetical protein M2103_000907 [Ereboglobus sp. PH5-5]|uniref:bestrophin-like domain n=1 Tax=Ereboglobus sp. PH5-5 TaxID=2940529 RepID=UPI002406F6D7|nr:hypothetical protein [Ereboglobus sp. PH5-5]MDF9832693.1 hypothetical protein [Ereboglobus sp. PH5-5]